MQDIDISAALVLAYSLRQLNTQAELVVLTTDSINEKGIKLLQSLYDRIVNIKYASIFTKYWGLALTEYKKVVLINANTIVLEQPDYIFSIDAPTFRRLFGKISILLKFLPSFIKTPLIPPSLIITFEPAPNIVMGYCLSKFLKKKDKSSTAEKPLISIS
jgi:hypothetical protein